VGYCRRYLGSAACIALLAALMAAPSAVAADTNSAVQFRINGYRLVSVSQVPGTPANQPLFDYAYKVDVLNGGSAAGRITATADTHGKALTLLDRDVSFGIVGPGETRTGTDTITVRAKRNFDRSLDTRTQKNGIWTFVESGGDEGDVGLFGALDNWTDAALKLYYDTKLKALLQWTFVVSFDTTAPSIGQSLPQGGTNSAQPTISATYGDNADGSGVDLKTVVLRLDGADVTAQAVKTAAGINWAWTFKTATPPVIAEQSPVYTWLGGGPLPTIRASFFDVGAGINTSKTRLQLNGADVTSQASATAEGIAYTVPTALADGSYTIDLAIADKAGNQTASRWSFSVTTPPSIGAVAPKGVTQPPDSKPVISAQFSDTHGGIDSTRIKLVLDGIDVTAQSQVSGAGISYVPLAALAAGQPTVYLEVANKANATAQRMWGFEAMEGFPYTMEFAGGVSGGRTWTYGTHGNWLRSRPWMIGLLCALMPFVWLWTLYPVKWDSKTAPGQVLSATIRSVDETFVTAGNGAIDARCYELQVMYRFTAAGASHEGIQGWETCNLGALKQFRAWLQAHDITVVYSAGDPATSFVLELVSSVKLKVAAGLAMTAFLVATRVFGVWAGMYRTDSWNISLAQVQPRFWLWTALLILFYGALIVW
jgi:hypothetical protein